MPELNRIYLGDCVTALHSWPDACVDAVVTDPPYELGFMGKSWDSTGIANDKKMWAEVLRVLKPGGHLLAFSATRTYHRMACAVEDAGFEIRDQLQWLYGSGFPKSLNVDKALDKKAGKADERGYVTPTGGLAGGTGNTVGCFTGRQLAAEPVTPEAQRWRGWGTALKPAAEPIVLARAPLSEDTVVANVLRWGTGALNIEDSRVGEETIETNGCGTMGVEPPIVPQRPDFVGVEHVGRWPANVLFDQYAAGFLDGKEADASRFFYVAKPDGGERNAGLEEQEAVPGGEATGRDEGSAGLRSPRAGAGRTGGNRNFHPTVKPVDLMAYLIQLVTPRGGVVLDPFLGSGTTAVAAVRLGHPYLGCEMSAEYLALAEKRIAAETAQGNLF